MLPSRLRVIDLLFNGWSWIVLALAVRRFSAAAPA
jgi:hypothetical protein